MGNLRVCLFGGDEESAESGENGEKQEIDLSCHSVFCICRNQYFNEIPARICRIGQKIREKNVLRRELNDLQREINVRTTEKLVRTTEIMTVQGKKMIEQRKNLFEQRKKMFCKGKLMFEQGKKMFCKGKFLREKLEIREIPAFAGMGMRERRIWICGGGGVKCRRAVARFLRGGLGKRMANANNAENAKPMTNTTKESAGAKFRRALTEENPLLIVGAVNAFCAILAEQAGFRALYLSGGGVAANMGMPDLAATTMHDVVADAARITAASQLPLLADADAGFGSWLNIARTTKELIRAGAAGMHLEDQVQAKRCGHRPNKTLVSPEEMSDRIRAAVDARFDGDFVIMARTDALAGETRESAIARAKMYVAAGADMIFVEAAKTLDDYRAFKAECGAPILANITEFGQTPLFTAAELRGAGADMMLFPLSAFRAMSRAAEEIYAVIRRDGGQKAALSAMQTREELYKLLRYHEHEKKMDLLFGESK